MNLSLKPRFPMSTITTDEFLDLLKRSGLLEDKTYEDALAEIKRDAPNEFCDASHLASEYVKRNLLTTWHVRQLMKRKYKGFYLRQYRILGHLGSGGMSSVYLGEHTVMKRRVAIKVLPKRRLNPTYLDRFAREAQAIASLDSQHVVRAYDVDRFEDVHYIVMEYFEGQNLRQLVEKEGPLDYEDAANYIRQAALGLADAHRCGVVHRDVKPDNIVVDEKGFVKILDLGLALLDEGAFALQGTTFDEDKILGTADYLAPEQALDSHNVDARADVYGLGATLYFCLVGKPPFPFGSISQRLLAHQRKEPASIFNERPDAPADLVEICSNMMAKKPENRIQSAEQVAEIMKHWLVRHGFAQPSDFASEDGDDLEGLQQINVEQNFLAANERATEIGSERIESSFRLSDDELNGLVSQKSEDSVDLYDAAESGTSMSRIKSSPSGKLLPKSGNLMLSQKTSLEEPLDPLELALSEIADTTKIKLASANQQNSPSASGVSEVKAGQSAQIINLTQFKQSSDQPTVPPQLSPTGTESNNLNLSQTVRFAANETNAVNQSARSVLNEPPRQTANVAPSSFGNAPYNAQNASTPVQNDMRNPFGDWYKEVPIWFWTVAFGGYAVAIFLAGILFTLLLNLN